MTEAEQRTLLNAWLDDPKNRAILFKVTRTYAFSAEDRDDLFQEIAVQVWRSVPAFKGNSQVSTWVYRVALNTALKWQRQEKKHYHGREEIGKSQGVLAEQAEPYDERLTWLYETLTRLDKVDRSVALLMLDGFSYKEVASLLGITENYVGVKINRIKKFLLSESKKLN